MNAGALGGLVVVASTRPAPTDMSAMPTHGFETFAAARATALVEQIRSYKLVRDIRDIRDMLAADRLETATYDLLARAAERAGDPDTAKLAERLRAAEREAADRLARQLDTALEIALLAE